MKKIKRFLTIGLAIMLTFCMSISFAGCGEEPVAGPIPNGKYDHYPGSSLRFFVYVEDSRNDTYCFVEGDDVEFANSEGFYYKAKIVEKDGKIYFEGYKWLDIGSIILKLVFIGERPSLEGSENIYLVEYNAEEKTITLELYEERVGSGFKLII